MIGHIINSIVFLLLGISFGFIIGRIYEKSKRERKWKNPYKDRI